MHDRKLILSEQSMKEIQADIDYWNNERIQARVKYRSFKEFKEVISLSGVYTAVVKTVLKSGDSSLSSVLAYKRKPRKNVFFLGKDEPALRQE